MGISRMQESGRSRWRAAVLAMVLGAAMAGCGGGGDSSTSADADYVAARLRWTLAAKVDYRFTLARTCFCLPESPIEITVTSGVVVSARYADTGLAVSAERQAQLPTLTGLLDLVAAAYVRPAALVQFTGNALLGFPERISIDYDSRVSDDEIGYTVTGFKV